MASELIRATWPLPWWALAIPALAIAVATGIVMAQPGQWLYVAPARASGLPAEALITVGPLVAVASCWVAERFVNRHSPLASPILPRAGGALGFRALVVLVVGWALVFSLVVCGALAFWRERATGGEFYPVEVVLSVVRLEFFIVSGFIIGTVVARWHAGIWALGWSAFWSQAAPTLYSAWMPGRSSNLEYFIFPALAASDHRDLSARAMSLVLIWWIFVIAALTLAMAGWYGLMAGRSRVLVGVGAFSLGVAATLGVALPIVARGAFVDGSPQPLSCASVRELTACVTQEQRSVLPPIVPRIEEAIDRMGSHLPADVSLVASNDAVPTALAAGYRMREILTLNLGSSSLSDPAFDMGVGLAGLDACSSGRPGAAWAFHFASWLAPDSNLAIPVEENPLLGIHDEKVLAWYTANEEALRDCNYTGDGA